MNYNKEYMVKRYPSMTDDEYNDAVRERKELVDGLRKRHGLLENEIKEFKEYQVDYVETDVNYTKNEKMSYMEKQELIAEKKLVHNIVTYHRGLSSSEIISIREELFAEE